MDIHVSAIAGPGDPVGAGADNWTKIGDGVSFPMMSPVEGKDLRLAKQFLEISTVAST